MRHLDDQRSHRRRRLLAAVAVLAVALVAAPSVQAADAGTQPFAATVADAQSGIDEAVASGAVDSISVSLTTTDALIWAGAGGKANAQGAPATASTTYGIGSVSKLLTTVAIMQLVEQGKVGLDQPVVTYLPQFTMRSPQYRQITVRMLLNHSAGLPGADYTNGFLTEPWDGYAQQMLSTLSRSRLKTIPGALSVYCNDCFTVAGEVVAAVSGMPFATYVERHILAPLDMTASTFATEQHGAPATIARTFTESGGVRPIEHTTIYASGGMLSTPTDMATFARMLLGRGTTAGVEMLLPQSVAEMGRSQVGTTLLPVRQPYQTYGLGWDGTEYAAAKAVGVRAWEKNGATSEYHSDFVVAPEAGIAVFVNAAGMNPAIDTVVGALAQRVLMHALVDEKVIDRLPTFGTQQPAKVPASVDDLNAILGTYLGARGMSFRVTRGSGDALRIDKLVEGEWMPFMEVTHRADGAWWATDQRMQSFRTVTGWGRTYLVIALDVGNGLMAEIVFSERVVQTGRTNSAWTARLGEWLIVKGFPTSAAWTLSPTMLLAAVPGLTGYVDFGGYPVDASKPGVGSMFLQIPMAFGRDQRDLEMTDSGLMHAGNDVLIERTAVPPLAAGANAVRIGRLGYVEWRVVPDAAQVSVRGASDWKLYESDVALQRAGRGAVTGLRAVGGSLLAVFGKPGQQVTVTLDP